MTEAADDFYTDCLVIGAGISGLMAAKVLSREGLDVLVLDKGRGVGGRMSTRRIDTHRFDHGAQCIVCSTEEFSAVARGWQREQVIHPCEYPSGSDAARSTFGPMCANGGMNSIAKHLAPDLRIKTGCRVTQVEWSKSSWFISTDNGTTITAKSIIMTPPAPQAIDILNRGGLGLAPKYESQLREITYERCIAVMSVLETSQALVPSGFVRPAKGPISLIVDNFAKGVSKAPGAITLHTTPEFTLRHWNVDDANIVAQLQEESREYLPTKSVVSVVHRWRYSRCINPHPERHILIKEPGPLAFAGDGFGGQDIEGAGLSGISAAEAMCAETAGA